MTHGKSKLSALFVTLWMSLGLLLSGCGEEAGQSEAPAEGGMTMDGADDKVEDGIDPETGNPREL